MRSLAYGLPFIATLAFFACGDDDSGSSIPTPVDGGASSSGSSSSSSSSSSGASSSSSSSTSSSSGDTAAREKTYCDAVASRKTTCGKGDGVCVESSKCLYARTMKPEATTTYAECYGAPSCKSDDECVEEAGAKAGGAAATDYRTACMAKHDDCAQAFADDYCGLGAYAYPNTGEAATACLAKPCADVKPCFTAALAAIQACK